MKSVCSTKERACNALDTNESSKKKHYCQRADRCDDRCKWPSQVQQIRRRGRRSLVTHREMVDKKLVATTVSSRETGLERRIEMVTMSSHEEKNKHTTKKTEFISPSKVRTARKSSLLGTKIKSTRKTVACDKNKKNYENDEAEAVQDEAMDTWKAKGRSSSSSKNSP